MIQTIWFFLWGLLWAVYFMLDGFDLGMGTLMPFLAKNDTEKRTILNVAGPVWDGNEVWLISAGGVTFAAFPAVYATMFSGLYTALMLLLFALILRGVSAEFRSKLEGPGWRSIWDFCYFIGSFLPALLFGVAFANIFKGIPIDQNGVFQGSILTLLNPYGLLGGVMFVLMFCIHGALWLAVRTSGSMQAKASNTARKLWPLFVLVVVAFLVYSLAGTTLFANYLKYPVLFLLLLVAVLGLVAMRLFIGAGKAVQAWISSAVTILGVTFFGLVGIFPALLPSSLKESYSLTAYNASSSPLTLDIMLVVAIIFVPIVIIYQAWVYKHFSHTITDEDLEYDEAY